MLSKARARAIIKGSDKYPNVRGKVLFYETRGGVIVAAEVRGLPTGGNCDEQIFAMHVHEGGRCSGNSTDPFADAGAHYNPDNCMHPYHAGDMPALFGNDGYALSIFFTNRFKVEDVVGRTVIVHRNPDDYRTQPSGNSGEKIACGVIEMD